MKLNLGCGFSKPNGFVNVDVFDECAPDIKMDLEVLPWNFEDNCADEILLNHSLEHLGATKEIFLGIIQELYRISKPGAKIQVNVPHPRHDFYLNDPTHVRPISPPLFELFSKKLNYEWQKKGWSNSQLALALNVDFEIKNVLQILDERYENLYQLKQISNQDLQKLILENNNIVSEYQITLEVIK